MISIIFIVLISAFINWILTDVAVLIGYKDNTYSYTSYENLLQKRYSRLNYDMVKVEDYNFITASKRTLFRKLEVFDIIYINENSNEFEYEFLHDGLGFDIDFCSVGFKENIEYAINNFGLCQVIQNKDYYIIYIIDSSNSVLGVEDNYNKFYTLKSIDYDNVYFFTAILKSEVDNEYLAEIKLVNEKILSFGLDEILFALD